LITSVFCQKKPEQIGDAYTLYKNKSVLFSDLGFSSSPYSINFRSANTPITKLKYRNNLGVIMGIGCTYKWFAVRLAFALTKNLKPVSKYGKTSYIDLGLDFPVKKMYFEFDLRNYKGYSIKNADIFNPNLAGDNTNEIRANANTLSIALNGWYLHNRDFKMQPMKGKVGHFNRQVITWYLKNTINIQGIGDIESIIPYELTDSLNTKTKSSTLSAFDFGVIPGIGYANKYKNWQFAGMFGFGPVVQSKFYIISEAARGFLGLAPRYDLRLIAGYNVPKWFVMLSTEFDNKSIRFNELKYKNNSYTLRLVAGFRLDKKEKIKEKNIKKNKTH
jgi:hypothetical protein